MEEAHRMEEEVHHMEEDHLMEEVRQEEEEIPLEVMEIGRQILGMTIRVMADGQTLRTAGMIDSLTYWLSLGSSSM